MYTTARLSIDNFRASVRLAADNWQPGDPSERFDVVQVGVEDRKAAADAELAKRGYTRVGGWDYDAGRDVHVTAVAPLDGED